ncbi:Protein GVQW3 like protein [Argiope bruennichi]|uniref:Protein GVQW3 like protein n=1 Tax=Argiope bruennichi TaxID=94029 RepID=A0A8T0ET51_ARGBR|nr:Protein GVQW3 like protein [Argiope bruennichi]
MVIVYGEDFVSVRKWSALFRAGCENLVDDPRPGQENAIITVDHIDKGGRLVRSDRRVTLRMLAVKVDASVETVWTIVHNRLRYRGSARSGFRSS